VCNTREENDKYVNKYFVGKPKVKKYTRKPGFAWSYTANMLIRMISYDICLLPAQFCYLIVFIRKVESREQNRGPVCT
jgi:hypothetical protein